LYIQDLSGIFPNKGCPLYTSNITCTSLFLCFLFFLLILHLANHHVLMIFTPTHFTKSVPFSLCLLPILVQAVTISVLIFVSLDCLFFQNIFIL
jgi:hypothetical protein